MGHMNDGSTEGLGHHGLTYHSQAHMADLPVHPDLHEAQIFGDSWSWALTIESGHNCLACSLWVWSSALRAGTRSF